MPAHNAERREESRSERDADDPVHDLDGGIKDQREITALEQGVAEQGGQSDVAESVRYECAG
ncbi:MAG TPA: hypothetical protein VHK01_11735 [Lacipirellulaceae bacterium]|nr:hypothetical protein [Lacipirellulaceae bacterium]